MIRNLSRFLSLIVAVLAVVSIAGRSALAADAPRPNILFIIFDDADRQLFSAYGNTWCKTPNFDRVAREGILFKNFFTSNPKCSPCRATALTGRNTWQLEEAVCHGGIFPAKFTRDSVGVKAGDKLEVYPDLLEAAGYFVGLTGKGWGPGDFKVTGWKRNPAGPGFDEKTAKPIAGGINNNDYSANFADFLNQRPKEKPFCFWMGFKEPHRQYELNSGLRLGKKLEEVTVPAYLPDLKAIRGDLADYAIEIEWGDMHIGRTLKILEERGELDNTLIVVTSDHGMPFPYVKGQIHEDGFHIPAAARWGKVIKPGRVVEDFVNIRDLAPTYMELAGLKPHNQMTGSSLVKLLASDKSGWIEPEREYMLIGKERHDIGRPNDLGYPVRAIRSKEYLYVHNFHPERWPAGNPETDFGNVDPSPSKEIIKAIGGHFYDLSFGKRMPDELYNLRLDPNGVNNLANDLAHKDVLDDLRYRMMEMLKKEMDPRALGDQAIFDTYQYVGGRTKGYDTWLKAQEEKARQFIDAAAADKDAKAEKRAKKKGAPGASKKEN